MGVIKTIVSPIFVLLIAIALGAETISIFQKGDKADFLRLGSRSNHRQRRSADDDRGAQSVYYVSRTPGVWGSAWLTCRQAMDGQLLTIETRAEDQFIRDLLIENHIQSVWTSGAYDFELGIWRWVATGGEITYTNWLPGQPIGPIDISTRISLENSLFSAGWKTMSEDTANYYICEVRSDAVPQPTPSTTTTTTTTTEIPTIPTTPTEPTTPAPPETTTYTHIDPPPEFVVREVTGMPALFEDKPKLPLEPKYI